MKILFDHNMPWGLRKPLSRHDVSRARDMGWAELSNGELLKAAEEAGFYLFLTGDRNIRYQQNLRSRRISIIELTTIQWPLVQLFFEAIVEAVEKSSPGGYNIVECRPPGDALVRARK